MDNQSEKNNLLENLKCHEHQNLPITFVCISHEDCNKDNLLCMECIDELDGNDHHQLISIKKFSKFVHSYEKHAGDCLKNTQTIVKNIRNQINQKIDELQFSSITQFEYSGLSSRLDPEKLRQKTKMIAKRKIWNQLQKKTNESIEFQVEIQNQVKHNQKMTAEILDQLLSYANKSFDKLKNDSKIETSNSSNSKCIKTRLRKRQMIQKFTASSQNNESEKQLIAGNIENDEVDMELIDDEQFLKSRRGKKVRYRRYAMEQKVRILSMIKTAADKKIVAKKYRIATSTLLRWQKNFAEKGIKITQKQPVEAKKKKQNLNCPNQIKIQDSL